MSNGAVAAIDPGYSKSALIVLDRGQITMATLTGNESILWCLRDTRMGAMPLVIEQVQSYGMAVGKDVFETCVWSGRFWEAWSPRAVHQLPRREVKLHLCGQARAKDPNVRQALIDRYGPGKEAAIGRKAAPGPLYGIKADLWAALAVAVTWADLNLETVA